MQRKIRVVLPGLQEQAEEQRNSGRGFFFFFGKGEPGFAFVSWVCLQGCLDVKHGSNSSCILAQDFGKLTGLKGKTKCLSCKLITGLSIFRLSGEFAVLVVQLFALQFVDFLIFLILGCSLPKTKAEGSAASSAHSRLPTPLLVFEAFSCCVDNGNPSAQPRPPWRTVIPKQMHKISVQWIKAFSTFKGSSPQAEGLQQGIWDAAAGFAWLWAEHLAPGPPHPSSKTH